QVISIVILVIMVLGFTLAGVVMRGPAQGDTDNEGQADRQTITYNGYEFKRSGQKYAGEVDGQTRRFYYPPTRTVAVRNTGNYTELVRSGATITFDPARSDVKFVDVARYELTQHIDGLTSAVTQSSPEYNLPTRTCADATSSRPVIFLNASNMTGVTRHENCVVINGKKREMIRATERVIYEKLGVIG
ncbi:MAG: hypothetical protein ABEI52_13370, partial [Halobacteriaceae archaeon]